MVFIGCLSFTHKNETLIFDNEILNYEIIKFNIQADLCGAHVPLAEHACHCRRAAVRDLRGAVPPLDGAQLREQRPQRRHGRRRRDTFRNLSIFTGFGFWHMRCVPFHALYLLTDRMTFPTPNLNSLALESTIL